jgi:hypothetical protein
MKKTLEIVVFLAKMSIDFLFTLIFAVGMIGVFSMKAHITVNWLVFFMLFMPMSVFVLLELSKYPRES